VYGYSTFNESVNAQNIKGLVLNHAVNAMSIHAGRLAQMGKNVVSGIIREVSLVMSGANSGATIDNLAFAHGEFGEEIDLDEAIISLGTEFELFHAEESAPAAEVIPPVSEVVPPVAEIEHASPAPAPAPASAAAETKPTVASVLATLNSDQKVAVGLLFDSVDGDTSAKPDIKVLESLNADQKAAVGFTIDELKKAAAAESTDTSAKHSEMGPIWNSSLTFLMISLVRGARSRFLPTRISCDHGVGKEARFFPRRVHRAHD